MYRRVGVSACRRGIRGSALAKLRFEIVLAFLHPGQETQASRLCALHFEFVVALFFLPAI
jgi:hypothetical protein